MESRKLEGQAMGSETAPDQKTLEPQTNEVIPPQYEEEIWQILSGPQAQLGIALGAARG